MVFNLIITIVVLLFSDVIGNDQEAAASKVPVSQETPIVKSSFNQKHFDPRRYEQIDKEGFLAAFKRQSDHALLQCLKSWRSTPSHVVISATLIKQGRLTAINSVNSEHALPECLEQKLLTMRFETAVHKMQAESQVIDWRVDW